MGTRAEQQTRKIRLHFLTPSFVQPKRSLVLAPMRGERQQEARDLQLELEDRLENPPTFVEWMSTNLH